MGRSLAREIAMKQTFSRLLGGEGEYLELLRLSDVSGEADQRDKEFAELLCRGVEENQEDLDGYISRFSERWSVERISKVEICILRIAVYELLNCQGIPSSVSINEAVELAKTFGGEKSPAFINGVLGGIARWLEEKDQ